MKRQHPQQQPLQVEEETIASSGEVSSNKRTRLFDNTTTFSTSHWNSVVDVSSSNDAADTSIQECYQRVAILQDQLLERQKRNAITDGQNAQLKTDLEYLKQRSTDSKSKIKTLETHNSELRKYIKEKEVLNSEQQIVHEQLHQKWEIENAKLASNLKNLENELREAKEEKDGSLKEKLEEMRQQLYFQRNEAAQQSYEENLEIEKLQEELLKVRKEVIEKDEQLAELQERRLIIDEEVDGNDEKDIVDKLAKNQAEFVKVKKQCDLLEGQMKDEKEKFLVKFNEMKTQNETFAASNAQLKNEKETLQNQNSNFQKIVQNLENQISILRFDAATKETEQNHSKKELKKAKKQCKSIHHQYLDEKAKNATLQFELKKSQNVVEEKEIQIRELKNLNNVQQNEMILKAESKAKDLGDQLLKSQSNFLTAKVQAENWKTKSINIQTQLEALKKTTEEEKENGKKRVQKLKAENEQLLLANANIKAEKEKAEKEFADFQLAATSKTLQLRKINDENHSKLNEALCDKNDAILTSLIEGPKWIVSKEICQAIYDSNPKLIDFLKHFTLRLFSPTEILLSERTLDSAKWKEAKAVIFHFFKPGDQKAVYVNLLQKEMQTKRYLARTKAYGHCVPNRRAIGFADTGKVYFFQLQANNNQWEPFFDEECQVLAMFKTFENCPFGFPTDLPPPEFIVIVSLQKNGHGIYKFTSAGYLEEIFTKANNGGEKKASNN